MRQSARTQPVSVLACQMREVHGRIKTLERFIFTPIFQEKVQTSTLLAAQQDIEMENLLHQLQLKQDLELQRLKAEFDAKKEAALLELQEQFANELANEGTNKVDL